MVRWIKQMDAWKELTFSDLKKAFQHSKKGKGLFHEIEKELYNKFLNRRALGFRVSYSWIRAQMKILIRKRNPNGYDPSKHKFKNNWVRRFCIRWEISLRRKPNTKCSTVFERYSQINNYDKWLIYHFQDPGNFDEPYFNHEVFVEKVKQTVEADEDPNEKKFEMEEESEISSDSF